MKRTDLRDGEVYAFRNNSYGEHAKVRVIDTSPCLRWVRGSMWSGKGVGSNSDGLKIVIAADSPTSIYGVSYVTDDQHKEALQEPDKYRNRPHIEMYDGIDEESGNQILRVLPRYISKTWVEHEAAEKASAENTERLRVLSAKKAEWLAERVSLLPEELQEFFEIQRYSDSELYAISPRKVEELLELLLSED